MRKALTLLLVSLLLLTLCACSASDYKAAEELRSAGDYAAAREAFRALGSYKDSEQLADECGYAIASARFEDGDYENAAEAFRKLGAYSDSEERVQECGYQIATALFDSGDYPAAMDAFAKLSGYRDSSERIAEASDLYLRQALLGNWTSELMDESDIFLGEDTLFNGEEGEEMKPYFHFDPFLSRYHLSLPEDGSFTLGVDTELFTESADAMLSRMREGFHAYFTESMERDLTADGLSLEDVYKDFGVDDMDGLIAASLGMPLDDFIALAFPREDLIVIAEDSDESGTLSVENGVIVLKNDLEDIPGSYDPSTDTLTLQDGDRSIPFHRNTP